MAGKLVHTYHNMRGRIRCDPAYKWLPILPRRVFYRWALEDPTYRVLFRAWEKSGYQLKVSPSIDRINPNLGYVIGNIRWLTHSDNSRFGAQHKEKTGEKQTMRGKKAKALRRLIYGTSVLRKDEKLPSETQGRLLRLGRNIYRRAKKFARGTDYKAVSSAAVRAVELFGGAIRNEARQTSSGSGTSS